MTNNNGGVSESLGRRPERIGPFRILDTLGEGGMAEVYLAEQLEPVKRRVALKVLKAGMDSKQVVARFESERQALAFLDHPNIAKFFDGGVTDGGRPYFVMELVRGVPITQYCDDHRLDTESRLKLFASVCGAVQHAHHKGLIHRDLKPSNILVASIDNHPVAKVIDFGIAKATSTTLTEQTLVTRIGQIVGTPQYMSPEQAGVTGLDVDMRTDVYSLGVVLYELLVGVVPLDIAAVADQAVRMVLLERDPPKPSTRITELGDTKDEIARARRTDSKRLQSLLKGDLDWIAMKAMEKDRTLRYATVNGLELDVRRHLAREPVTAGSPGTIYRVKKFLRRHRIGVASTMAIAAALVVGAILATVGMIRAQEARKQAEVEARTAEQTTDFMVSMFMEADPARAKGADLTAREILDSGAERIDSELGEQPQVRATLMTTMGLIYMQLGLHDRAQALLEQAVATRRELDNVENADIATSIRYLAEVHRLAGRYDESEAMYREALAMVRGSLSQAEVSSMSGLLLVFQAVGNYDEAEVLARDALAIQRQVSDDNEDSIANALNDLGSILHDQGDFEAAENHYKEAIEIGRSVLGDAHPNLASYINNLAALYNDLGQPDLAEPLHRESVDMRKILYGDMHPRVGRALNNLGLTLSLQEKYDDAEAMYGEALMIRRETLGESHPDYAESLHNLGILKRQTGILDEAESYFREAMQIYAATLGDSHPRPNLMRAQVAFLLVDANKVEEAETLAREAIDKFNPNVAGRHPWYHVARVALAECLAARNNHAEAEQLFLDAIQAMREITGDSSGASQSGMVRLVKYYERTNQSAKAEKYRDILEQ